MTFNPVKSDKQYLPRGVRFLRCESEGILESFHIFLPTFLVKFVQLPRVYLLCESILFRYFNLLRKLRLNEPTMPFK